MKPVPDARKALILFSDGEDNSSAHDLMDAIEAAQTSDSLFYTVRYTEAKKGPAHRAQPYGVREMDRLAGETGGAAFDASKKEVGSLLMQVGEELRSLYEAGYTSTNPAQDGSFRGAGQARLLRALIRIESLHVMTYRSVRDCMRNVVRVILMLSPAWGSARSVLFRRRL
jgi:hypothetical protein